MLSRRTIIGNVIGGIITGVGVFALILALGVQTSNIDEGMGVGEYRSYKFEALTGSHESLQITGDRFNVTITTSGDYQVPPTIEKDQASFDWIVSSDGTNRIEIENTGSTDLNVIASFEYQTDPILYAYHVMVIIAGVVIIGFSAIFSVRKPRGF
jgi:hypothetical protein